MGKTGRKRRGRKKKAANHGKRPNAELSPSSTSPRTGAGRGLRCSQGSRARVAHSV